MAETQRQYVAAGRHRRKDFQRQNEIRRLRFSGHPRFLIIARKGYAEALFRQMAIGMSWIDLAAEPERL
jgi:hypothetical protein